jgi:hypothetical protein
MTSSVEPMDLLDEESHRLLLWAVRLHEAGGTPTRKELRRLAEPRRPAGRSVVDGLSGRPVEYSETALASLTRRGLLEELVDERIVPSDLGRLVISALGLHPEESPLFEVIETDLRSSDPLGFARIVGRIAALDRPMVIDPFCRRPELEYLVAHTSVSRVLVSDRLSDEDLSDLSECVESIRRRDAKLRLRVAPAEAIHDRHVLDGDRVLQVGGTPHGMGGGTTVLCEPLDLGGAARGYYRQVWKRARRLATYRPDGRTADRAA